MRSGCEEGEGEGWPAGGLPARATQAAGRPCPNAEVNQLGRFVPDANVAGAVGKRSTTPCPKVPSDVHFSVAPCSLWSVCLLAIIIRN